MNETGIDQATVDKLVKFAHMTRNLKGSGLEEGAITRLLVHAAKLIGSAFNLNTHFHMLFLDEVYVECRDGSLRPRWAKVPTSTELSRLAHIITRRVGRFLEREGLLARDADNRYLAGEAENEGLMHQLLGSSITYRIAVGPQQGRSGYPVDTVGVRSAVRRSSESSSIRTLNLPHRP